MTADAPGAEAGGALTIRAVDPLAYADGIKALFAAHGRADFAAFFDAAYPTAVRAGARSWIALDAAGAVVMHVACFVHHFRQGALRLSGGLRANLMVAGPYRRYFPARALLTRLVADCRAERRLDFVYGAPNRGAVNVLEAAGFRVVGRMQRFVLPLAGASRSARLATSAYLALCRARQPRLALPPELVAAADFDVGACELPPGESPRLRAEHPAHVYGWRLPGYPAAADRWARFGGEAAALLRGPDAQGTVTLVDLHAPPERPLGALVHRLVPALRRLGATRLQTAALADSQHARELRRAGFLGREWNPMLALALSARGESALRSPRQWQLTPLDYDG